MVPTEFAMFTVAGGDSISGRPRTPTSCHIISRRSSREAPQETRLYPTQWEITATAMMTNISQNKADNIQPTKRASAGKASTKRMIIRRRCKAPMRT
jgi:hypothetical protein